jgi:hypothetical protein
MKASRTFLAVILALSGASPLASVASPAPARAQDDNFEGSAFDASNDSSTGDASPGDEARRSSMSPRDIPARYVVRRGDTLWDVTGRFFGDPFLWPRIWSYNPDITNPHWIYPEGQLRLVPEPGTPQAAAAAAAAAPSAQRGAPRLRIGRSSNGGVLLREEGFLDRDALRESGEVVGSPADHMLLTTFDEVYLQFDPEQETPVAPGQEWTIFTEAEGADAPESPAGTLIRIYGAARIDTYDRERRNARATIIEALEPIERGHRVAAVPRRFDEVPPRRNERDLRARIIASLRPRTLLGEQQVIFLDVGGEQGVVAGNRLFVVRQGDDWRAGLADESIEPGSSAQVQRTAAEFPEEIVAEIRIVHVRPRTSTAIVTASTRELAIGDCAEMRRGY